MTIPALTSGVNQNLILTMVAVAAFAVIAYALYLKYQEQHPAQVVRSY